MKKPTVEFNRGRKSPYRVKYGNLYVYLSTRDEAERVKQFIYKVLKAKL